ncbi:immunoglobulin-like domain-containing protein [Microbacterium sp. ZW T5_45]|uniref:immunoglobulin-like domain-containing protein n=1 Tax=Microbacterium sp. ZW T5_45 TaxID=3378080 RepID=UPI003853B92F
MSASRPSPTRRRRLTAAGIVGTLAASLCAFAPAAAMAADIPAPTAHYDMSHSGTTLWDVSGNGRNATLTGFTDASFVDAGGDDVLRFKKDGYAALPQGLVTGGDNAFTVEYTVSTQTAANQFGWVIGNGVGAWNTTQLGNHVFVNPRSGESSYSNQVLSGIRVKTATANGETRLPAGGGLNPGFTTLTLVGSGNTLTLYRDGQVISTTTHTANLSSIVPASGTLGYLGRSLYTGDALLAADVTDVRFWDTSLTAEQVSASMPTEAEKQATTQALLRGDLLPIVTGANTSLDAVRTNLTFPASSNGVALTWSSSDPSVVSNTGVVSRAITSDTTVTITATPASGSPITFSVTVVAASASADLDAIELSARTTENLPLVTKGAVDGSTITWSSSDESLVTATDAGYTAPAVGAADTYRGGGIVERPAYGTGDRDVTLTAHATLNGTTLSREFTVTVAEHARTAPDAGYASAYFKSDGDEKIYQAATSGNDFFTFSPVNDGKAVITSTTDTTGLRDPYILRSHDGDKYYMIATDLCISCGTGWGPAQSEGSLKVEVWESTDMVTWERTNGENSGITINQPEAGMTWAPEAYWDDDLESYVVFFASRKYSDASHSNSDNLYARMFYVTTRDFQTFTYPPTTWQDTGYARIDSTVTKIGEYYYRFTKNEESGAAGTLEAGKDIFLERSTVLTAPTTSSNWNADPTQTWQLTDTRMTSLETGQAGEGPEIIKLNEGDPNNTSGDGYVFLVDNYSAGGYRAFLTTGAEIASSSQADRLSKRANWNVRPAGGLPTSPRHGAFVSVPQTVLTALHDWTGIEAVDSTTALAITGNRATATVTAADGGEVAGTVTFTGGAWSQTVGLVDGTASVDVPAGVSAVTTTYDGYADGLVSTSVSAEVPVSALTITTTASIRCVAGKAQVVVSLHNPSAIAATVTATTPYGAKTVTLAAGASTTASFASRLVSVPGGTVAVSATASGGATFTGTAPIPAGTCN